MFAYINNKGALTTKSRCKKFKKSRCEKLKTWANRSKTGQKQVKKEIQMHQQTNMHMKERKEMDFFHVLF